MKQQQSEHLTKFILLSVKIWETGTKIYTFLFKSIIIFPFIIMLFACENDISTINSLSHIDSLPMEVAHDIEVYYSDSGKIQAYLQSPLMERFEEEGGKGEYTEFREGFKIIFYDSVLNPESQITADYGIRYDKNKLMEAKNNVVVTSIKNNEQLETEHLVWNEKKKIIYSDVFVKITRSEEVLYGDGLISDENFSSYTIKNPSGEFQINPDEQ